MLTCIGAPGLYIDAIVQGTWYDVNSTANRGLPTLHTRGLGLAGSLEGGHPLKLGNGYFVEPQAEIVYQRIKLNNATIAETSVRFDGVESFTGRLGVRIGRTRVVSATDPRLITAWFRPNLWYEFLGAPKRGLSSADGFFPFRGDISGAWLELNAGIIGQISPRSDVFANVSYQTRFKEASYAYTGKVGVRFLW